MPAFSVESLGGGSIVVFRGAIDDAGLLEEFGAECGTLVDRGVAYTKTSAPTSPNPVETVDWALKDLQSQPAIQEVASQVATLVSKLLYVAINRQGPGSYQNFHKDAKSQPVSVVHGNDGGAFDYVPVGTPMADCGPHAVSNNRGETVTAYRPAAFQSIELGAGDVLTQVYPGLIHRGRNPSDEPRITVGMYTS